MKTSVHATLTDIEDIVIEQTNRLRYLLQTHDAQDFEGSANVARLARAGALIEAGGSSISEVLSS